MAAEAGTDATPELVLSNVVSPVLLMQQRPPLASSGYFPGTIGIVAGPVASNTSHCGIFGSGVGRAIVRVNWVLIINDEAAARNYTLRRVDSPFTGFPSIRATPGYINAGPTATGSVFSVTKTDTVGASGIAIAQILIEANSQQRLVGPWILNDGILLVSHNTVNKSVIFAAGYECWPAIRAQTGG